MIDLPTANARGIVVTNGSGTNTQAVADHAMTLLLAIAGTLVPSVEAVRRGEWSNFSSPQRDAASVGERTDFPYRRIQVSSKKLGILGLGLIGQQIAHRAADGFDMEVAYHNRQPVEGVPYAYKETLVELAEWSDFLILAAPGGDATYHIVNRQVLQALGPNGYLVNIGRGTVVDTDDLVAALKAREIAGAALDVVEGEPDIPAALLTTDHLLLTPHIAGRSPEALDAMITLVEQNLTAHFSGQPLRNRVN
jgi:lactate dehydrogenase-like 2-hydroxyacid dehydrogenase